MLPLFLHSPFGIDAKKPADHASASLGGHGQIPVLRLGAAATVRLPLQPPAQSGGAGWLPRPVRGMRDPALRHGFERALLLARLGALRHQGDAAYYLMARMAARMCRTPMAAVTLLDDRTQWIQGGFGTTLDSMPLQMAFCRYALASPAALTVIADTRADPRVAAHPMVMHAPYLRFYAGAPLVHPQGLVLGAVCVVDVRPRELRQSQFDSLQWLARVAMHTMLRRAPGQAALAAQAAQAA